MVCLESGHPLNLGKRISRPFVMPLEKNILLTDIGFKGTIPFFAGAIYEVKNPGYTAYVDIFYTEPNEYPYLYPMMPKDNAITVRCVKD